MSSLEYLERLLQDYKISCTVPKHPKKCIDCGSKVSVFQINFFEAIFMCSNINCLWPLETHEPEDILGKSDVNKRVAYLLYKRRLREEIPM